MGNAGCSGDALIVPMPLPPLGITLGRHCEELREMQC